MNIAQMKQRLYQFFLQFTAPQAHLACTGGSGLVVLTRADSGA